MVDDSRMIDKKCIKIANLFSGLYLVIWT